MPAVAAIHCNSCEKSTSFVQLHIIQCVIYYVCVVHTGAQLCRVGEGNIANNHSITFVVVGFVLYKFELYGAEPKSVAQVVACIG